jgi:hypothetical protein
MQLAVVGVCLLGFVVSCGDPDEPGDGSPESVDVTVTPAIGTASTTTIGAMSDPAPDALVIERRAMTDEERIRLDESDPPPLDCPDVGEAFWDYDGSVTTGPPDRTADDALVEVIDGLNDQARAALPAEIEWVPYTGWVELVDGDSSTFVHTNGNWRFAITIGGNADRHDWRPHGALTCPPEVVATDGAP